LQTPARRKRNRAYKKQHDQPLVILVRRSNDSMWLERGGPRWLKEGLKSGLNRPTQKTVDPTHKSHAPRRGSTTREPSIGRGPGGGSSRKKGRPKAPRGSSPAQTKGSLFAPVNGDARRPCSWPWAASGAEVLQTLHDRVGTKVSSRPTAAKSPSGSESPFRPRPRPRPLQLVGGTSTRHLNPARPAVPLSLPCNISLGVRGDYPSWGSARGRRGGKQ